MGGAGVGTGLVVLVDDDDAVRRALTLLLKSYGWHVRAFASAREFLAVAPPHGRPSCLIVDYHMPDMSGLELLARVRARGCRVPAILITGRVDGRLRIRRAAEALAPAAFIEKPLDNDELVRTVSTALAASV
ncbi:MAG: response regulator [Alphaproteobacteria bacterium]|nr:response regulator [Alphaproteobacteria bacterium]